MIRQRQKLEKIKNLKQLKDMLEHKKKINGILEGKFCFEIRTNLFGPSKGGIGMNVYTVNPRIKTDIRDSEYCLHVRDYFATEMVLPIFYDQIIVWDDHPLSEKIAIQTKDLFKKDNLVQLVVSSYW